MSITIAAVAAAALALVVPGTALAAEPITADTVVSDATTDATRPAVAAAQAAPAAIPSPAGTGDYEWICVTLNGTTLEMAPGEPLTNCQGAYLQKYLDGRHLDTIALTPQGTPATWDGDLGACLLSVAGLGGTTVALVLSPPTGIAAWVATGVSAGTGVLSLSACAG